MAYYTLTDYMSRLYDERGRQHPVDASSVENYEIWKKSARQILKDITGISIIESMPRVPLNPILLDEIKIDNYTQQNWLIQTELDVQMPFYLLIPDQPNGAAMINPHGHGAGRDASIGNINNPFVKEMRERFPDMNRDTFAVQAAKKGYVVACPDARGSGDRREKGQQGDESEKQRMNSHREINQMALGFGISMVGFMVWDLMRLVDFVLTLPQIDQDRIGCLGMSGGGQQTLYLAAMDDRISAAITSGYFYGFKEALMLQPGNCSCNFVPHMWETMDMGDLGAMIAPRAFLVESGKLDNLNGAPLIDNVIPQVDIARSAFALYGAEEKLFHSIHEEGHKYNGQHVFPFLEKWL